MASLEAPVRPRVEVFVTGPAKLKGWAWDDLVVEAEAPAAAAPAPNLRAYYARMAATFRAMPRPAHHEHGPTGELERF
jgi:hypothetical protein